MRKQAEERQKEIAATAIAIGGKIVLTAVAVITSVVLQKNRQTQKSRAEGSTPATSAPADGSNSQPQATNTPTPTPTLQPCPEGWVINDTIWCTSGDEDWHCENIPDCDDCRNNGCPTFTVCKRLDLKRTERCHQDSDENWYGCYTCVAPTQPISITPTWTPPVIATPTLTPSANQIEDNEPPDRPNKVGDPSLVSIDGKEYTRFTWKWAKDNPENGVGYCKAYRDNDGNVIKYASSRYKNVGCKPNKNLASPFRWQVVVERTNGGSVVLYKCYDNKIQVYNDGGYRIGGEGCGYTTRFDVPLEKVNSLGQVRRVRIDLRARDAFGNIRDWREDGAVTVIRYCVAKDKGDANCDGNIDIADYGIWLGEFRNGCSSNNNNEGSCLGDADGDGKLMDAVFDKDGVANMGDYYLWYQSYSAQ